MATGLFGLVAVLTVQTKDRGASGCNSFWVQYGIYLSIEERPNGWAKSKEIM
jgi:hypothetical protein